MFQVPFLFGLTLASTLALMLVNVDLTSASCLVFFVRDVLHAIAGQEALAALLFLALAWLYVRFTFAPDVWKRGDRWRVSLLALAFAAVSALGAVYRADDGLLAGFFHWHHLLLLALKAAGFFALFFVGMKALLFSLQGAARKISFAKQAEPRAIRRCFLTAWVLIACAWLPSFLAHFPGTITADGGRVLQQYFGEIMLTSDHPLGYTALLGSVVALGSWVGGDWFGIFLYTLFQWVFLLSVMAWTVAELKREGFPALFTIGLTAFYALGPMSMLSGTAIIKDIPYAAAFLAYLVMLTKAFLHPKEAWQSKRWWLGYTVFSLLLLLLRHNGLMVILPMSLVLLCFFQHENKPQKHLRHGLILLPMVVMLAFNQWVVPRYAFVVESAPDTLGITIQQTARILKNDPASVSAEELAAIDQVLEASQLADAYSPHQSDPVRKLYRYFNNHTKADVLAYSKVAAKLAIRHPITAMHAACSLSLGYLDLFDVQYTNCNAGIYDTSPKYPKSIQLEASAGFSALQDRLRGFEEVYLSLPLVSQLKSVGLYTWALFVLWFLIRRTKERKLAWLLVPMLMTLLACLLSAGFAGGSRYAFPMVFAVPYVGCVLLRRGLAE
ncbi:MAG: DUF6020 family protein [Clostridia bacterium]